MNFTFTFINAISSTFQFFMQGFCSGIIFTLPEGFSFNISSGEHLQ